MDTSSVEVHTIVTPIAPVLDEFKLLLELRVIRMNLSENVASHCASQVQLTAHAKRLCGAVRSDD
jgi:hypothetical protein